MRIVNCDLDLKLRIIGKGKPSITISTDEGDGCGFFYSGEEPKPHHYTEWASQLSKIAEELKKRSRLTTDESDATYGLSKR